MLNIIIHIDFLQVPYLPLYILVYISKYVAIGNISLPTILCSTDTLLSAANVLKGYAQDTHRLERDLL